MWAKIINLFFSCYTIFLMIRVIGSWIPQFRYHNFMRFIAHYTDPYLNIFRRLIPPIGGMIDLSPLVGFIFLELMQKFILLFVR